MDRLYKLLPSMFFPSDSVTGTLGSVNLNMAMIHWTGIPLFDDKSESMLFKIPMVIYGVIILFIMTFTYPVLEMYDMTLCWRNLNELTENSALSFTHIAGAIKMVNVFYRRKDIMRTIQQFKFLTKKYILSEEQKKAFYLGEFENKLLLSMYFCFVLYTGIMGMVMLMIDPINVAGKGFPYRVKMPEFLPYGFQLGYMSLGITFCALQVVGLDYLNVTLINQTRYQMKVLNIAFDNLAVKGETDIDVNKYIHTLVEHHNFILDVRKEIESIFKFPLLLQFCTSLLIFAMTGFQTTVQSESSGTVMIYFYCGGIFSELFFYCWFGNEVSEQNKTLASRGYNSSWYNFDRRYKRSLMIFLMNAQRPFYFTAGGFVELSLVTFSGILSKSYTYIAVLRQINAE